MPFFRYPDVSGLGQESQFEPPMRADTPPAPASTSDQVLSQDAYGSDTDGDHRRASACRCPTSPWDAW